jgi:hypothetical protein
MSDFIFDPQHYDHAPELRENVGRRVLGHIFSQRGTHPDPKVLAGQAGALAVELVVRWLNTFTLSAPIVLYCERCGQYLTAESADELGATVSFGTVAMLATAHPCEGRSG